MEIVDAKKEYSRALWELFEVSFGQNYMSVESIEGYITQGTPFKIALDRKELMGAILFIPASTEKAAGHVRMDRETVGALCGEKPALICKCACTYAKYQGQGAAKRLLTACLEDAKKSGYGAVFTVLWEYGGSVPAEKMFVDAQFQRGGKLIMPWYGEADYICSECGGRCRCNGIVYYKKI